MNKRFIFTVVVACMVVLTFMSGIGQAQLRCQGGMSGLVYTGSYIYYCNNDTHWGHFIRYQVRFSDGQYHDAVKCVPRSTLEPLGKVGDINFSPGLTGPCLG
jgi:hypothetical protein